MERRSNATLRTQIASTLLLIEDRVISWQIASDTLAHMGAPDYVIARVLHGYARKMRGDALLHEQLGFVRAPDWLQ